MRPVRPILCALLAVLTAVGGALPAARGCACPIDCRAAVPAAEPNCCHKSKAAKGCRPAAPPPPSAAGLCCPCPICDPAVPAPRQPPAVPPSGDDGGAFDAGLAVAVSPALLPPPADRVVGPAFTAALPPPDLVTTLSRRTC